MTGAPCFVTAAHNARRRSVQRRRTFVLADGSRRRPRAGCGAYERARYSHCMSGHLQVLIGLIVVVVGVVVLFAMDRFNRW